MSTSDRILDIFDAASDLPLEQRTAYLDAACGTDTAMRAEVESLLRSHDGAGRFLSNATVDVKPEALSQSSPHLISNAVTIASARDEHYGQMVGRYKLLEVIGEGGFGTVWMAEQREPVKRRVALKIIKLGMDTRQVIARFEAERQALALMDHSCIAKVLDAGSTESGRPYFVMEYIKGVPILEYCDTEKLNTEARLKLFTQICQAIQHAHQKGIIHRDIKPGNVLVTLHDGVPVPKVIDFGIAKATSAELTQRTLFTEHRQLIGTPAYMSPEQAEMSGLDIDTRSDIYSLGVLLYELLTGTTPFASEELLSRGFAEMLRIIREVEPQKPSTRLSTLGAVAARTAQQRMTSDSRRLASILQGDLDWIVMKCLEKDRTRRYDSASGLAADVRRYLADEPVTAGAPTTVYRLQKFVRRNRGVVFATTAIAGMLVLGIAGTSLGLLQAVRERARAVDEAARAEEARGNEARARVRAETIADFVTDALRSADAQNLGEVSGSGQDMTVFAAMQNAVKEVQSGRFKDDPETEARLLDTIAEVLRNNGRVSDAEPLVDRAVELRRTTKVDEVELARSLEHLAVVRMEMGLLSEAERQMREVLAIRRRLHTDGDASLAGTLQALGSILEQQAKLEEADSCGTEALELSRRLHPGDHPEVAICMNNLALTKQTRGDMAAAKALCLEALEMHRRLYPGDHPEVAAGWHNLGVVQARMGRLEEAEPSFLQAIQMRERLFKGDHQATAGSLGSLASVRRGLGRLDEAEPLAERALAMHRRLFRGDHPRVAVAIASLASIREALGRLPEAEALYNEALEMSQRVFEGDSLDTATYLSSLALVRRQMGRPGEAEPLLAEGLRMREVMFGGDHPLIVSSLRAHATVLRDLDRAQDAEAALQRADEMAARLNRQ